MVTKPKSNSVVRAAVQAEGGGIVFEVLNAGRVVLDLARVSEENKRHAMLHGLVQRVSDAAAIPCDTKTGKSASPAEKFAAIQALVEFYNTGTKEWRKPKAGGAAKGARSSLGSAADAALVLQAMAEVYNTTVEVMGEKVAKNAARYGITTGEYLADALRVSAGAQSDKPIAALSRKYNALRGDAGMATGPVDADDLMAELEGGV